MPKLDILKGVDSYIKEASETNKASGKANYFGYN